MPYVPSLIGGGITTEQPRSRADIPAIAWGGPLYYWFVGTPPGGTPYDKPAEGTDLSKVYDGNNWRNGYRQGL